MRQQGSLNPNPKPQNWAQGTPWAVRLIAKVHWGAHPKGLDDLLPGDERIGVMHHYLGSWKIKGGWRHRRLSWHSVWRLLRRALHLGCAPDPLAPLPPAASCTRGEVLVESSRAGPALSSQLRLVAGV